LGYGTTALCDTDSLQISAIEIFLLTYLLTYLQAFQTVTVYQM